MIFGQAPQSFPNRPTESGIINTRMLSTCRDSLLLEYIVTHSFAYEFNTVRSWRQMHDTTY
jgi:hypothetical protein